MDSRVTPLVTQSVQAFQDTITELEPIAGGLESGEWTDGLQKTSVWPDVVCSRPGQARLSTTPPAPTSCPH